MDGTYNVFHGMDSAQRRPLGTAIFKDGKYAGGTYPGIVETFAGEDIAKRATFDEVQGAMLTKTFVPASESGGERQRRVEKRGEEDLFADDSEVELAAGDIVKTDPDQRVVFGWAYVVKDAEGQQVVDKSGDFVDSEQIEEFAKSAYDYVLKSRAADADHTNVKGGEMVESIVFTPEKIEKMGLPLGTPLGWWVGYKIDDEATWQRVKKGELKSFSIHGQGTRTKVDPDLP